MSTSMDLKKTLQDGAESGRVNCDRTACRLGACPPCLIVWGIFAVFLIGKAVLEVLR